jgi:spoIIIJ-associated protein
MPADTERKAVEFVGLIVKQMGLALEARAESTADGVRINLDGEGGEALLAHKGEGLQALQHIVDTAFRRQLGERRLLIDCMGYRRDKDNELRQMARHLADRAKSTGVEQNIGPLNSYERRIVHLAVAEDPDVTSESIGDAAVKTVVISKKTKRV